LLFISIFAQAQKDTVSLNSFVKTDSTVKTVLIQNFDSLIKGANTNHTIAQILQNFSSIYVKSYANSGLATLSLRGTGASHTTVFYESLPLNSPMNGQLDFNLLPVVFFDKMHLTIGNASLKNTIGGIGGSIELSNNKTKKNVFDITQTIASYANYSTSVKSFFKKNKFSFDTRLFYQNATNNFKYFDYGPTDGLVEKKADNASFNKYGSKLRVNYSKRKMRSFIDVFYFHSFRELPPALNTTSDDTQEDNIMWALWGIDFTLNKLLLKNRLMLEKQELIFNSINTGISSKSDVNNFQNALTAKYFLNDNLNLSLSSVFQFSKAYNKSYTEEKSQKISDNKLQVSCNKNNWTVDFINRSVFFNKQLFGFIPYLGISKLFNKKKTLIGASASKNIHLPTLNDLYWNPGGNPILQPEIALSSELFITQTIIKNKTINSSITIQGYYGEISNWILWHPAGNYWQADNIKNVLNKGIEVFIDVTVKHSKFTTGTSVNYAYNSVINKDVYDNNESILDKQLIYVPYHSAAVLLFYRTKKYYLEYNLKYTGKRYTTTDNSWYLPENYPSNMKISRSYRIKNLKTVLSFNVYNIFDQPYQLVTNRPMPGRNYSISLNITF
tara:strand:- start:6000 stop:7838 length:1839 start_codon:yes stop_codon:yes gene_type:complete